jgi:hypothetical protein
MNRNKIIFNSLALLSLFSVDMHAGGGNTAGAVLGGFAGGAVVGSLLSRPRERYVVQERVIQQPVPVYYQQPQNNSYSYDMNRRLQQLEDEIRRYQRELAREREEREELEQENRRLKKASRARSKKRNAGLKAIKEEEEVDADY